MKPPPFDYVVPDRLDEALAVLDEYRDEAQPIAGGQSLTPMLALRVARPGVILDLQKIPELQGITLVDGGIRIGAMTRQVDVLNSPLVAQHLPALADAMKLVGHFQTRNRGTLGGSISLGEPAAENPAFAVALDAELELASVSGSRVILASAFYTGPYMTERADDELLVSITYRPPANARIGIEEVMQRRGDFALSGLVACLGTDAGGTINDPRLAWMGMGTRPLRAKQTEDAMRGMTLPGLDIEALADLALADADPFEDSHGTPEYRLAAGRTVFRRLMSRLAS
jgi:carbon-monoxide dehydrogenase medium subunit